MVSDTTYVDAALEPDRSYFYRIVLEAAGETWPSAVSGRLGFGLLAPQLLDVAVDGRRGQAVLLWTGYDGPEFTAYEIVRRQGSDEEFAQVGWVSEIADTTFVDATLQLDAVKQQVEWRWGFLPPSGLGLTAGTARFNQSWLVLSGFPYGLILEMVQGQARDWVQGPVLWADEVESGTSWSGMALAVNGSGQPLLIITAGDRRYEVEAVLPPAAEDGLPAEAVHGLLLSTGNQSTVSEVRT